MKFFPIFLPMILLAASSCTSGSKGASASRGGSEGKRIQIFYNNDNFAYLETCGCRVSPIGGMDRRFNAMMVYPAEGRIFVDSGNLLFKSPDPAESLVPQWRAQAEGVIEAYNLLHADAVAPGENDFALGLPKLKELLRKARFPYLSSNIEFKKDQKLVFQDSVVLERHGKKIGVFALFGSERRLPEGLRARDPLATARAMVKQLREKGADMVIALTHQGYDADVALATAVSGIDLIAGSHSQSLIQKPDLENGSLIVQLSNQGQVIGMVEYEALSLPETRTQFLVQDLDDQFNESPRGLANPMKGLAAITKIRMEEVNRRAEQEAANHSGAPPDSQASPYSTFMSCRDCHENQAAFQEGKPHAAAFLTLMAKHQERNLDCVKCHSVGMGEQGGFRNLADAFRDQRDAPISLEKIRGILGKNFPSPGLSYRANEEQTKKDVHRWINGLKEAGVRKAFVSVQCENCHGRLPGHPFGGFSPGKVSVQSCVKCHTPEQAPAWYSGGALNKEKATAAIAAMACPR